MSVNPLNRDVCVLVFIWLHRLNPRGVVVFAVIRPYRGSVRVAAATIAVVVLPLAGPPVALAHPPGTTELASVSTQGTAGDNESTLAAISADGRFVAFWSFASNLVPGDTNGAPD